ncbi:MAG: SAM-dependent methyltransferase [Deltaproteobacteria bacterium]|nr:SAM-dependent methyltransferase [Deltaproteobacteria bacterium]
MPTRTVFHAEALAWVAANEPPPHASVVTSLPDVSEIPSLDFPAWRAWFVRAAREMIRWTPPEGVTIFFQSDIRRGGTIVDKGYLVSRAAEEEGVDLLFHKVVCRKPPGTIAFGRPSWSHMLAFSKTERPAPRHPGPDVLPSAGTMPWSRAMGVEACRVACRYLVEETATRVVVDPFCGLGTVLAVANQLGLDAIGVDLSAKRCKKARALEVEG